MKRYSVSKEGVVRVTDKPSIRDLAAELAGTRYAFCYSSHPTPTSAKYVFQHAVAISRYEAIEVINTAKGVLAGLITNGQARRIAADWHGGMWTALYSFTSTGAIAMDLDREIERELDQLKRTKFDPEDETGQAILDLHALLNYVKVRGPRGLQDGWERAWDETPVTTDQGKLI